MQYINSNKLKEIQLNKDNFYVLMDFDRTITIPGSISCWRVLYYSTILGPNFRKKYDEIHNKVIPKRDNMLKSKYYEDRFEAFMKLLESHKLTDEIVDDAVKETPLVFRSNAKTFFEKMYQLQIPVIIISSSIKNVIDKVLKTHNCYYDNMEIYGNYFDYSIHKNHICNITPYNKNKINFSDAMKSKIISREYIVLLGDLVEDINMVSKDKLENTITIGFLDEDKGIKENLEKYKNSFDVVLTNNASFEDIIIF